ncbi:MAG TPA: DUF420 domain-containing protein [Pyrinomonadaceae bacterium]|jgi:uncharacterized membrane protein YozB (DUF420 family)
MPYDLLPHLNAALNATSGVLLATGYLLIRQGKVRAHLTCMLAALAASVAFLVSYLVYHAHHGTTRFAGQGLARPLYFFILTTHTVLAAVIVPLVAVTLRRALGGDYARHRRVARWTFPVWLYVSATGVLVYLMLYQLYPAP